MTLSAELCALRAEASALYAALLEDLSAGTTSGAAAAAAVEEIELRIGRMHELLAAQRPAQARAQLCQALVDQAARRNASAASLEAAVVAAKAAVAGSAELAALGGA